ncbi:hypothetical protein Cfor_11639 [Coptotermes formosanus]|uniref:Peptidase S1 domain-containing protein n=1 Tax=Coptotermes formosanus TaxID=36987 RepID=A0A6L2PZZ0_COPFO|nr:hypothetical protein Cfor_11639 [Coptotermes formosanus]
MIISLRYRISQSNKGKQINTDYRLSVKWKNRYDLSGYKTLSDWSNKTLFAQYRNSMFRFLLLASLVACSTGANLPLRRPRLDGRIIGGSAVGIEDFPYQVSIEYAGSHMCGGAIIGPVWVVTAAHCVDGVSASNLRVRAGSIIWGTGGTLHLVSQIIVNPHYDYYTFDYDVALIAVSVPFFYGISVQPIPLAVQKPGPGVTGVVSGWRNSSTGSSPRLQAISVIIASDSLCNAAYAQHGVITANTICASANGGGTGACQGNSGSPLAVGGELAGLVSWGIGCAGFNYLDVFSNIARVRSFIISNTGII